MSGPRDPNDVAEQELEEHRRRFPTDAEYEHAVAQGMGMDAEFDPDERDHMDDRDFDRRG